MWSLARLLLLLGGLVLSALSESAPAAAQASCLPPADARNAAQASRVIPLSILRGRIAMALGGEVVSAQLCQYNGRFVYVVNVLGHRGVVRRVMIDAESGSPMN